MSKNCMYVINTLKLEIIDKNSYRFKITPDLRIPRKFCIST